MRVLHVISNLDTAAGGTTRFVHGLAEAQARRGLDVSVISTWAGKSEPCEVADALRAAGVSVRQVGPARGRLMRHPDLSASLAQAIGAAEVVHIHALWEQIQHQAAKIARQLGKPYLISPHGMLDPWSLRQSRWVKRLFLALRVRKNLQRAGALHFTCTVERDLVNSMNLGPAAIVEPPGLDFSEFEPLPARGFLREKLRDRIADIENCKLILFLSRIHPKKGLDLLIPAFSKLRDAILVIAGPDSDGYEATVRQSIEKLNLADRTLFTGMLHGRERIAALVDADLFVLPSYQENFGIAVTESLAAGAPVVISDQVNIHTEITAANVGGVVPMNIDALAREMQRWLAEDALRTDAGRRARVFARERYDWGQIAARWAGHYAGLPRR